MDRTERVAAICACPVCHSELVWEAQSLRCGACETAYRLQDGIPILVPPQVGLPQTDPRWVSEPALRSHPRLREFSQRCRRRISRPLTYKSKRSRQVVERFVASFSPGKSILNVGSGRTRYGEDVINLEIAPEPGVDLVGVAEFLPVATGSCEGVILMAVLEHVQDGQKTLSEAKRVLAPEGLLLVDVPFIQGYHAGPGDYRRYTEQGLRTEVERFGFVVEDSGVAVGPASAMAWITSEFLALLVSGRSPLAYRIARNITSLIASPIKYADYWLEAHPMASQIPSAVWVLARAVR